MKKPTKEMLKAAELAIRKFDSDMGWMCHTYPYDKSAAVAVMAALAILPRRPKSRKGGREG
jgi:hypothetical protein